MTGIPLDVYAHVCVRSNLRTGAALDGGGFISAIAQIAMADGGETTAHIRNLGDLGEVIKENKYMTSGFFVTDWNDDRDDNLLITEKKTKGSLSALVQAIEYEGVNEVFVLTHSDRPKGKYNEKMTLLPMVERIKKFLDFAAKEEGFELEPGGETVKLSIPRKDVVVEFLKYKAEDKSTADYFSRVQKQINEARSKYKGKKIIFLDREKGWIINKPGQQLCMYLLTYVCFFF